MKAMKKRMSIETEALYLETAAKLARGGNRLISFVVLLLILLMFLYGGYSLWDTAMVYQGAFLSNDLLKFKPPSTEEADNPTLSELQAINGDVRGWVTIDDTHIDYPVVQGQTDMDYINKDVYGEFALAGSIFLDNDNSPDFSDSYNLLYGHHMDSGGMFGDVVEFAETDYFESHPTGTLYTMNGNYSISIFACIETDAYDSVVFNHTQQKDGDVSGLLEHIEEKQVQSREIGVTAQDTIIGLSTCAEAQTNGRVIIYGRLDRMSQAQEGGVKPDEKENE